jgi:hypothetical protein
MTSTMIDSDDRTPRLIFLLVAAVFVLTGLITSTWIALAQFDDPFCYGPVQLWNAADPGALYFSDAVDFFSPSKIECFHHPGLTLDLIAGTVIRVAYLLTAPFLGFEDYHLYVATHRFFFFGLCSFLSTLGFLACCQPLWLLVRRLEMAGLAPIVCALFLSSVPVLLFINRFSDEPYYLLFGLWALELGLRATEAPKPYRLLFLSGSSMALSILAKPMMLTAFLLLGVYIIARSRHRTAGLLLIAAGAMTAGAPLLLKLPVRPWLNILVMEGHNRNHSITPFEFLSRPDQLPLVPHHIVLLCAAAIGTVLLVTMGGKRQRDGAIALLSLALVMAALVARRPDWHYFFAWYWSVLTLAAAGTVLLMRKLVGRPSLAAPSAFLVLLLVLDLWGYRALLSTYNQYYDRWERRWPIAQSDPTALPAVWEKSVGDTNLTEIFPVRSEQLQRALTDLRQRASDKR